MHEDNAAAIAELATKHGLSEGAVKAALTGLAHGNGRQAQFDHPDLGGLGQWSSGGMVMIGDMFNNGLKAKVASLFEDLLPLQAATAERGKTIRSTTSRWPAELGPPASTGSQSDMHYAIFPETGRVAVEDGGKLTVYALGHRRITGVGQQQSGTRSLGFTGPDGSVSLDALEKIDFKGEKTLPVAAGEPDARSTSQPPADIEGRIERLHDLLLKGALTQQEFDDAKKKILTQL